LVFVVNTQPLILFLSQINSGWKWILLWCLYQFAKNIWYCVWYCWSSDPSRQTQKGLNLIYKIADNLTLFLVTALNTKF